MAEWIQATYKIKGRILLQLDGDPNFHEIGTFEQGFPIRFEAPDGELPATVKFTGGDFDD